MSSFSRISIFHVVLALLVLMCGVRQGASQCGGCGACTRRYGCMTPSWGRCCTQFFMQNGKRSGSGGNDEYEAMAQRLTNYWKSKNQHPETFGSEGAIHTISKVGPLPPASVMSKRKQP